MTFYLSVKAPGMEEELDLQCGSESRCKIVYQKSYTPRIFFLTPPVVYYESYTEVFFDPKSMTNVIRDLEKE
jgi:hypothetical protein